MMKENPKISPKLNPVKNRFLPMPESALKCLEPEQSLDDFEVIKTLGVGSFGKVYSARHKKTGVIYAIKEINKLNKNNQEGKPYFRREIEIMYKVHHPNVVRVFNHFEDSKSCYFVMEYIPGGDLLHLLHSDKAKSLETKKVAMIMKDLISAVYYLHHMEPPIIHRDIKPENILLDKDGKIKLTDFGWSNYANTNEIRSTYCGTPLYLAPEMIKEIGHDEHLDIWCIGVLMFELLTGNVPFKGKDLQSLNKNILNLKICWTKDINMDAKNLISKILKPEPEKRISLENMLKHPFFTKNLGMSEDILKKCLIKPDHAKFRPFIISKEIPPKLQIVDNKIVILDNIKKTDNKSSASNLLELVNKKTNSEISAGIQDNNSNSNISEFHSQKSSALEDETDQSLNNLQPNGTMNNINVITNNNDNIKKNAIYTPNKNDNYGITKEIIEESSPSKISIATSKDTISGQGSLLPINTKELYDNLKKAYETLTTAYNQVILEKDEINKKLESANQKISFMTKEKESLLKELEERENKKLELVSQNAEMNQQISEKEDRLKSLSFQVKNLKENKQKNIEEMKDQITEYEKLINLKNDENNNLLKKVKDLEKKLKLCGARSFKKYSNSSNILFQNMDVDIEKLKNEYKTETDYDVLEEINEENNTINSGSINSNKSKGISTENRNRIINLRPGKKKSSSENISNNNNENENENKIEIKSNMISAEEFKAYKDKMEAELNMNKEYFEKEIKDLRNELKREKETYNANLKRKEEEIIKLTKAESEIKAQEAKKYEKIIEKYDKTLVQRETEIENLKFKVKKSEMFAKQNVKK